MREGSGISRYGEEKGLLGYETFARSGETLPSGRTAALRRRQEKDMSSEASPSPAGPAPGIGSGPGAGPHCSELSLVIFSAWA